MTRQNLFDFATSELSQDAFLCWLVANASQEERPDLRAVGLALIGWLSNNGQHGGTTPDQIHLLGSGPDRQRKHCDIFFEAEVAGRRTKFLIEDKTGTSQHSDQLARYKRDLGFGDGDVLVYFKTGYHFPVDLQAKDDGYTVIGLERWVEFLNKHRIANDIYEDYRSHAENLLLERKKNIAALWGPHGHEKLNEDYVQFEFINSLATRCPETVGSASGNGTAYHGTNRGGTPWSQYQFASFAAALTGGMDEALFYRVDARNDPKGVRCYYLSTRQYAVVKGKPEARVEKVRRLRAHVTAFDQAVQAAKGAGSPLTFSRPGADNQGANESEVGILFFGGDTNTIACVLEHFPLVHRAFVNSLRQGSVT